MDFNHILFAVGLGAATLIWIILVGSYIRGWIKYCALNLTLEILTTLGIIIISCLGISFWHEWFISMKG